MSCNVYFNVPNTIGYVRLLFMFVSMIFMSVYQSPGLAMFFYTLSYMLDAFDGYFARLYGQCTKLGEAIDMATDRISTMTLLFAISRVSCEKYLILLQMFAILDWASHYLHVYKSALNSQAKHKSLHHIRSRFLRAYYGYSQVLFILCTLNEAFLVSLYLLQHNRKSKLLMTITEVLVTPFLAKQFINIVQLMEAVKSLAAMENKVKF